MNEYLRVRPEKIDGIGPWVWAKGDIFAWTEPRDDWPAIRDLVLGHVKVRRCAVQAGGCMGMYPRLWSEHFDCVYTFEPDPINFHCLSANCGSNKIIKFQAALGVRSGVGAFSPGPDFNKGQGRMTEEAGRIPIVALDALNLRDIDFIQLDCEEGEGNAIMGAAATIIRDRPAILIEAPKTELIGLLDDWGYKEVGHAGVNPDRLFV